MITAIIPQFFTADLEATLRYYQNQLGFKIQFVHGEPAFYAGMIRDGQSLFFRVVDSMPIPPLTKFEEEHLDAYIQVDQIDDLYTEYQSRNVTFVREIGTTPWGVREFVVKDGDGRLLCFGQVVYSPGQIS